MSELRFQGKSDDGSHLNLVDGEGNEFSLRINDHLRAVINQPRLAAVSTDTPIEGISVKEMQKRLRAGESAESIARDGNISVERVERFAGPILSERIWVITQAHEVSLRKESPREPFTFIDIITAKLAPRGVDADSLTWHTHRKEDGSWHLELSYPTSSGSSQDLGRARWSFEMSRRSIHPEDDNARWLLGEEPAPRTQEPGLVYSQTPAPRPVIDLTRIEEGEEEIAQEPVTETFEAPRLVAVREEPSEVDAQDGIKGRAKVPSWDEIMFGIKPKADE